MFLRSTFRMRAAGVALACGVAALLPCSAALAQTGVYGVARVGPQLDADLRFNKADSTAPSTFPKNADFKTGVAGELGIGYDFGGFRLEGTAGYDTAGANTERLQNKQTAASGRLKTFNLGISGYYDIDLGGSLRPYIGGGIGAARTDARLSRTGTAAPRIGVGGRMNGRDWGFRWHLDAGAGYALSEGTVLEVGARYAKISGLAIPGTAPNAAGVATARQYKPRATSTTLLVGLRQKF